MAPKSLSLGFGVRSFEHFPFNLSLVAFVLARPFFLRPKVEHVFHLPLDILAHDPFDVVIWHLFLLFL